jgi:hypothetical protein
MIRTLRLAIGLGAVLAAAVGCGGRTAVNTDAGEGDAIAVMTGMGGNNAGTGHGGSGGSTATTGSGGTTVPGSGGAIGTGAGGASGSVGTTGSGGVIGTGNGGATGTGGTTGTTGAGGQTGGVDAGIMNCVAGATCPTVNARCTAACGGGGNMVRVCFCDPTGRVACQNCMPPPPPACAANVATGRACNVAMNPPCGGCVNGQTESCTCMPAGFGGGGRGTWNCVIPVPVQACQ